MADVRHTNDEGFDAWWLDDDRRVITAMTEEGVTISAWRGPDRVGLRESTWVEIFDALEATPDA